MNEEQKRAWDDAKRDYVYGHARKRLILRLFWAVVLMGLGYRFFGVEI